MKRFANGYFITWKTYRLFISYSWKYGDAYKEMVKFLDEQGISYYDHSVPKDDPLHKNGTDKQFCESIDAKIKGCSGVIILGGVYASFSKWTDEGNTISGDCQKPIIGVPKNFNRCKKCYRKSC